MRTIEEIENKIISFKKELKNTLLKCNRSEIQRKIDILIWVLNK